MSMKEPDKIIGKSRGKREVALAFAAAHNASRPEFTRDYINTVFDLCEPDDMPDDAIVIGQSAHETADPEPWQSFWYESRGNPAGLGITGTPSQDNQSRTFQSGAEAARAQIAHLLLYATGRIDRGGLTPNDDPRYDAYVDAYGAKPMATTIGALAGKWAADTDYASGIIRHATAIFGPNLPDQSTDPPTGGEPVTDLNMTKGLIPLPDHVEDFINVAARDQSINCRGYDNLGNRPATPKFLVLHKSQCPPGASNSGYFHERCCPALTDWEVVAATGQMRRFVRRGDAPSGWANGVVKAPYGDALAWLNQHDWDTDTVNRDGEAIEITGWFPSPPVTQDTAVSEEAWQNIAQWMASRAHDYGITHETFPLIPAEANRSYITWHQEWTIGTGKTCPGPIIMNYTPTLIERARAIMKAAQTKDTKPVPKPPTYAAPIVPVWLTNDLKDGKPEDHSWTVEIDGEKVTVEVFAAHRPFTAIKSANRLQLPSVTAKKVGPRLNVRETFMGQSMAKVGKKVFIQTPYGTWIDNAALSPRISIRKA